MLQTETEANFEHKLDALRKTMETEMKPNEIV